MAQLKYQDPSNPADSTQFLAQTAQFTQVEKLGDIADLLKSQRLVGASGTGRADRHYMDENGATLTGVISAAKLNGDSEPMLRIGNTDVLLSKVMEVHPAAASTGSTGTPATRRQRRAPRHRGDRSHDRLTTHLPNPQRKHPCCVPSTPESVACTPTSR